MEVRVKVDQWDINLDLVFEVNREKFTDEKAEIVNTFWSDHDDRLEEAGSHFKAAIKLYAARCFELASYNNFITAEWVMGRFDSTKEHQGQEGFYSFESIGLKLKHIDNFFFESEHIEIVE